MVLLLSGCCLAVKAIPTGPPRKITDLGQLTSVELPVSKKARVWFSRVVTNGLSVPPTNRYELCHAEGLTMTPVCSHAVRPAFFTTNADASGLVYVVPTSNGDEIWRFVSSSATVLSIPTPPNPPLHVFAAAGNDTAAYLLTTAGTDTYLITVPWTGSPSTARVNVPAGTTALYATGSTNHPLNLVAAQKLYRIIGTSAQPIMSGAIPLQTVTRVVAHGAFLLVSTPSSVYEVSDGGVQELAFNAAKSPNVLDIAWGNEAWAIAEVQGQAHVWRRQANEFDTVGFPLAVANPGHLQPWQHGVLYSGTFTDSTGSTHPRLTALALDSANSTFTYHVRDLSPQYSVRRVMSDATEDSAFLDISSGTTPLHELHYW
ncbi:MAG: hypothetical protein U1E73_11465 [Planctomycetota bacterium]